MVAVKRVLSNHLQTIVREWDVGKPEHPEEALEYDLKMREKEKKDLERKARKERHHRSPTPETELPGLFMFLFNPQSATGR